MSPARPVPPALDRALGLDAYLTDTPGIGGRLRSEPEDFRVIELGGPKPGDGPFTAAFITLRNWETNRFIGQAAKRLGVRAGKVGFAGMKDKRAVTSQWFTFKCPADRLAALEDLQDVEVGEVRRANRPWYAGGHDGNRFVLRIRDHHGDRQTVQTAIDTIAAEGGVPHYFGPQRFGGGVRPITHLMGRAIVAGDLEEAVRLYCGHPIQGERPETYEARRIYEETRDAEAARDAFPVQMDHERAILGRLMDKPGDWPNALGAMPRNLRSLFVHAHQSWVFNHILSARLETGLGLRTAHVGDRVMAIEDDGTSTVPVTATNQRRVQDEIDAGRAVLTAPLVGIDAQSAAGEPGDLERRVITMLDIEPRDFRCREMPDVASTGRRRGILQHVGDLDVQWQDGDPVVAFSLGRGGYATVVMRELMKAGPDAY